MRINEDYLDIDGHRVDDAGSVLDHQLQVNEFCDIIDQIVADEYDGERPCFEYARDAIYPVDDRELRIVIKTLRKLYGFEEHMNLNWIDVSRVTSMYNLFYVEFLPGNQKAACNVDVSRWDVSSVRDMAFMFFHSSFNGDISKWDTRSLQNCGSMFAHSDFNVDISCWDISNIRYMTTMFYKSKMNRDLSRWDLTGLPYSGTIDMFVGTPMQNKYEWYPKGCES